MHAQKMCLIPEKLKQRAKKSLKCHSLGYRTKDIPLVIFLGSSTIPHEKRFCFSWCSICIRMLEGGNRSKGFNLVLPPCRISLVLQQNGTEVPCMLMHRGVVLIAPRHIPPDPVGCTYRSSYKDHHIPAMEFLYRSFHHSRSLDQWRFCSSATWKRTFRARQTQRPRSLGLFLVSYNCGISGKFI